MNNVQVTSDDDDVKIKLQTDDTQGWNVEQQQQVIIYMT